MRNTHPNDGRTADDYPLEPSPSTDTYAVGELNHAPEAHTASEYHDPDAGELETVEIILRGYATLEVAL